VALRLTLEQGACQLVAGATKSLIPGVFRDEPGVGRVARRVHGRHGGPRGNARNPNSSKDIGIPMNDHESHGATKPSR
jgi:hypothetical protein